MVKMVVGMVRPSELLNHKALLSPLGVGEVASAEEIGQAILSLREQMAGPNCMFRCDAFVLAIQFTSDDPIPRARIGDKVEPNAGVYDPASDEAMESARRTGQQIPRDTTS